jgi:hypothetical protein
VTLPNFLVVGAQKGGTTALYQYLKQHPEVYMSPVKEPHFFAFEGERLDLRGPRDLEILSHIAVTEVEAYRELFRGTSGETAVGEASAVYLYSPKAPERIKHHIPEAKLIAVLRHPAERAYSSFLHMVRDGREPLDDFAAALEAEEARIRGNWGHIWHYKRAGFYHAQLERYYERFEREQIRVYLHEDLDEDPAGVLRDVFRFLGVDGAFVPDTSTRHNVAGIHKSKSLHALHAFLIEPRPIKAALKPLLPTGLRRLAVALLVNGIRNRNLVKPPFPAEVRARLVEEYREDVLKVQGLIGRDLSKWLE